MAEQNRARGLAWTNDPHTHAAGGKARPYICDVAQEEQIVATVNAVAADWGRLDILINNVAISDNKHLFDITKAEWDRVFAVCLTAPMLFSKYGAKAMIAGGRGGKIVNVSSTSGHYGRGRAIAYTAAKAGILGLTKGLAGKLGADRIRVNAIAPGWVITERQKELWVTEQGLAAHVAKQCIKEVMQPDDIVGTVLFLASDASRMLTAQMLIVDGGFL